MSEGEQIWRGDNALDQLVHDVRQLAWGDIATLDADALRQRIVALRDNADALYRDTMPTSDPHEYITYLVDTFRQGMRHCDCSDGKVLEISGAWVRYFENAEKNYDYEYVEIFPKADDPAVILSDAINLENIEDETYDAVISVSVFEHINKPWLAADEIKRVLKPGGMTMHFVPFSFPFHGSPFDFWRYTPTAFDQLFEGFETIISEFYLPERRVNTLGTAHKTLEEEAPVFVHDSFGGWRDTSYTMYCGKKPVHYGELMCQRRREELMLSAIYAAFDGGIRLTNAPKVAAALIKNLCLDADGRLVMRNDSRASAFGGPPTPQEIEANLHRANAQNITPSHIRYLLRSHFHSVPELAGTEIAVSR